MMLQCPPPSGGEKRKRKKEDTSVPSMQNGDFPCCSGQETKIFLCKAVSNGNSDDVLFDLGPTPFTRICRLFFENLIN